MSFNSLYNYEDQLIDSSFFKILSIETGRFTKVHVAPRFNQDIHYTVGTQIIFRIPQECGIQELQGRTGMIVKKSQDEPNKLSIDIDSSEFSSFVNAPFYSLNPPTISINFISIKNHKKVIN